MEIQIREFKRNDTARIQEIHALCGNQFQFPTISGEFILYLANLKNFKLLCAEHGGMVKGFAGAQYYRSVHRAELGPVAVDPKYAGESIGSNLVSGMLEFLAGIGIGRVILRIKARNRRGIVFFVKQGFKTEAYLEKYVNEEDALQMVRFL